MPPRSNRSAAAAGARSSGASLKETLPADERPRERLLRHGPQTLSDAELLAVVLRTGLPGEMVTRLAQRLLDQFGGFWGLARASPGELAAVRGLKGAKIAQIKAAIEIGRRMAVAAPAERPSLRSPEDIARLVQWEMAALEQEQLRVLLLDTKNRVVGQRVVYQGSLNSTPVRVAEIFRDAIRENCAAIAVVHNHPSGDPTPSPEDIQVTRALVQAGRLLDIEVVDHVIIGRQRYVSLRERGLGFG